MSWAFVQYEYPTTYQFEKVILWISTTAKFYVATSNSPVGSEWSYYAGVSSSDHGLGTGLKLTAKTTENTARSDYWEATPDSNNRVLAVFPSPVLAKVVRLYVEDSSPVQIYEFRPSTLLLADEIMTGILTISDEFASAPKIQMVVNSQERILIGELDSDIYGIRGKDSSGDITFELRSNSDNPFVSNYADHKAIELELMKMNFQQISWAQFAIWDALDDESKRASPDPSPNQARVYQSKLDNGEDDTPDKEFGFVSKTYENITTVETGTSTNVGLNFLTDSSKSWFTDECKNLTLIDSASNTFNVESNTSDTLTVSGTPASGAYSLKDDDPQYMVGFASLEDSTNGGYGYVRMEVSFDNGNSYQTVYDTIGTNIDRRQATLVIDNPGVDYIVRIILKSDGSGNSPYLYKFLVCTDPSPWRY